MVSTWDSVCGTWGLKSPYLSSLTLFLPLGKAPLIPPNLLSRISINPSQVYYSFTGNSRELSLSYFFLYRQFIELSIRAGQNSSAIVSRKRKAKRIKKRAGKTKPNGFKAAVKAAHGFFNSQQAKIRAMHAGRAPAYEVHGRTSIAYYRMNRLIAEYVRRCANNEDSESIWRRLLLLSPECHQKG